MHKKFRIINIQGSKYDLRFLKTNHPFNLDEDWQFDIFSFLIEWYSDDYSIILQTSGSTGKPKILQSKKEFLIHSAQKTCAYFNLNENHTCLLCLPVKFIAGKMMIIRTLVSGMDLHFEKPAMELSVVNNHYNFLAITASQGRLSIKNKKTFDNIDTLIIGGEAVDRKLENQLQNIKCDCYESYGMTETLSHIALRKLNGEDRSEWFDVLKGIDIQTNEMGRLIILAPDLGHEKLLTNDLVEINKNNQFKWLGRLDNVINSGGIKICPENIEKNLQKSLSIPFFISGIPDPKLGSRLVLITNQPINNGEIFLKAIKENISDKYHWPKEIIQVKSFHYTESGKLIRPQSAKELEIISRIEI